MENDIIRIESLKEIDLYKRKIEKNSKEVNNYKFKY